MQLQTHIKEARAPKNFWAVLHMIRIRAIRPFPLVPRLFGARALSGSSLWGAVLPFHPGPIKTLWSSSFVRCLASLSSSDTKSPLIGRAVFWACRAKRPAANPWGLAWLVRLVFFTREVPACRVFISVGDPRINEVKPREEASLDGGDVASASPAARGRQVWRL